MREKTYEEKHICMSEDKHVRNMTHEGKHVYMWIKTYVKKYIYASEEKPVYVDKEICGKRHICE